MFLNSLVALLSFSGLASALPLDRLTSDEVDVVKLSFDLMSIDSTTGSEHDVSMFLREWLREKDWTVEIQPVVGDRENIFAHHGSPEECRILFCSHMDTVPPFIPPTLTEETLAGRGATDAKTQIASQLAAATHLLDQNLIPQSHLCLLYVVGEEVDHVGVAKANELGLHFDAVIMGEPTEGHLATGHKGLVWTKLSSQGVAAHSGYPDVGKSAISPMLDVLQDLENYAWPVDKALGPTTLNVGLVSGGVAGNVVPAAASAEVVIRVVTTAHDVLNTVQGIVNSRVNASFIVQDDPFVCDVLEGFSTAPMAYGTDLPYLRGEHRSYLMGAGSILVAHTPDEKIALPELRAHVDTLVRLALDVYKALPPV